MVTGGHESYQPPFIDSTEIYNDNVWRTITAKLPTPMRRMRVATINNRVLLFGNSLFLIKLKCTYKRCISSGGEYSEGYKKDVLEFIHETESWTVIGEMKEPKSDHAVSVVSFQDYKNWVN